MGIMVAYGSYVKDDANLVKSINQIEIFDTAVAFLAGVSTLYPRHTITPPITAITVSTAAALVRVICAGFVSHFAVEVGWDSDRDLIVNLREFLLPYFFASVHILDFWTYIEVCHHTETAVCAPCRKTP